MRKYSDYDKIWIKYEKDKTLTYDKYKSKLDALYKKINELNKMRDAELDKLKTIVRQKSDKVRDF